MATFIPVPLPAQHNAHVRYYLYPTCPPGSRAAIQEVWARMPDSTTQSGESNVELLSIVLDVQSHSSMRVILS
jgi:hypothetical protein